MGVVFTAIGLAVHILKWHFLIAGYNNMSKEKKANVDTERLGRLIGIYFYVNGGILIIMGILQAFGLKPGLTPAIVFIAISTVYLLIKVQKYDGNIYDENGKLRKSAGKQLAMVVGIVAVILIFVAVMMFFSSQATKVNFLEDGVKIHGMYGEVFTWNSIKTVKLIEELPNIEKRTNGSALGSNLKGNFRTSELGSVKFFVNTQTLPFIYLKTDDGITIFNMKDADETQEIFIEILRHLQQTESVGQ